MCVRGCEPVDRAIAENFRIESILDTQDYILLCVPESPLLMGTDGVGFSCGNFEMSPMLPHVSIALQVCTTIGKTAFLVAAT